MDLSFAQTAMPCCVHRLSTSSAPALHFPWRRRYSSRCRRKGIRLRKNVFQLSLKNNYLPLQGQFREDNFNEAMAVLHTVGDAASGDKRGRRGGIKGGEAGSSCFKIIKMIMEKNFSPVVVFSFSKKECEFYALQMSKLDFNSNEEKKLVGEVFQNAMEVLSEEDRKLPQVEQVLPLLKRGIGIHHGGNALKFILFLVSLI